VQKPALSLSVPLNSSAFRVITKYSYYRCHKRRSAGRYRATKHKELRRPSV